MAVGGFGVAVAGGVGEFVAVGRSVGELVDGGVAVFVGDVVVGGELVGVSVGERVAVDGGVVAVGGRGMLVGVAVEGRVAVGAAGTAVSVVTAASCENRLVAVSATMGVLLRFSPNQFC